MLSSKIKVTHPPRGIPSTLRSPKTTPFLIVSAGPKGNKMYTRERAREAVMRNWKIMPIQILVTIGEKMGEKMEKMALTVTAHQFGTLAKRLRLTLPRSLHSLSTPAW